MLLKVAVIKQLPSCLTLFTGVISYLKGLVGHAILGDFSTDQMVIELTKK